MIDERVHLFLSSPFSVFWDVDTAGEREVDDEAEADMTW